MTSPDASAPAVLQSAERPPKSASGGVRDLWIVPAIAAVGLLGWAGYGALTRQPWASAAGVDGLVPTAGNWVTAVVIAACAVLAIVGYLVPRRARYRKISARGVHMPVFLVIATLAVTAVILGFVSYLPCDDTGVHGLGAATWTVTLFVGSLEGSVIGPDATGACAGQIPLAMQLARFASITATFIGAIAALLVVSREALSRWSVYRAREIDLVIGIDALGVPLVKALVAERALRARPDGFTSAWERLIRRPRIAVLHPTRDDAFAAEAVAAGAVVLTGEPTAEALRPILARRGGVSPRRVFLVAPDQEQNLRVLDEVEKIFASSLDKTSASKSLGSRVIPRVIVRLDDPREARAWRLAAATATTGWFVDAVTVDDVLAESIASYAADAGGRRVVLAGDTPLTMRLLEEFAWRAWKHERMAQGPHGRTWTDRATVENVTLVGEGAARVEQDWSEHGPPSASAVNAPKVTSGAGSEWEAAIDAVVDPADDGVVIILAIESAELLARAPRIARRFPRACVMAYDPTVSGVSAIARADGTGASARIPSVVRFGPTLLDGERAPEDTWTKLARFQHLRWAANSPGTAASSRPWGGSADDDRRARDRGVVSDPLRLLPDFYREDNLRQQRHVLSTLAAKGSQEWGIRWGIVSTDEPAEPLTEQQRLELARAEHDRWVRLRLARGWSGFDQESVVARKGGTSYGEETPAARKHRLEESRMNQYMIGWESGEPLGRKKDVDTSLDEEALREARRARATKLREDNLAGVDRILEALNAWGIAPVKDRP